MALTAEGVSFIAGSVVGAVTPFSSANTYLGVGNGSNAFQASQTNLMGSSTTRKSMDAGYPIRSGQHITFRATFGSSEANFVWNEWGIFNDAVAGLMLNRVVGYNGTKISGQTWVLEVEITFTA